MRKWNNRWLVIVIGLCCGWAVGCDSGDGDDGEIPEAGTTIYFAPDSAHPERSLVPSPNVIGLNTQNVPPTVSLSSMCYEAGSVVEKTIKDLETLNGFGTFSTGSIMAHSTAPLDPNSLQERVLLVDLGTFGGDGSDADLAHPIPVMTVLTSVGKNLNGCDKDPVSVPTLVIVPMSSTGLPVILKGNHLYAVAILDGVLDEDGDKVLPSYVWVLLRNKTLIQPDPQTPNYETMLALRGIQEAYAPALDALEATGISRDDIILGWTFNTQFIDEGLSSIQARLGSLGDAFDSTEVTVPATTLPIPPLPAENFLGAMQMNCAAIGGCSGISNFMSGQFTSPNFQQMVDIPLPYQAKDGEPDKVPGTFQGSNLAPEVQGAAGNTIPFLASIPNLSALGLPADYAYPVVIFQHPLTPTDPAAAQTVNKLALFGIANALGSAGIATIAIDTVLAGTRAVTVNNALTSTPQLYPLINSDVMVTRDNLRQTVVDLFQLTRVLKTCTSPGVCQGCYSPAPEDCVSLNINPDKIYFLGASMGSVVGSLFTALSSDVKKAVFNAPVAGLLDTLAGSPVLAPQLAPSLCTAGLISQACCDPDPTSCTPDDISNDPGFVTFKISAQWLLDPADPVNYARKLAAQALAGSKKIFITQATNDDVFPNLATQFFAGLLEFVTESKYKSYDPGDCANTPGGAHGMLLANCGQGTVDMQTDIVTFFATD